MLGGLFELRMQLLLAIAFLISLRVSAQDPGKRIFEENCMVCHTIGGGPLVGPDLKSVNSKHDEEWLVKFIQSSQTMVNSGDEKAAKIFNEFNMIPMPDQLFDKSELLSILSYIKIESEGESNVNPGLVDNESIIENIESNKEIVLGTKNTYMSLLPPFLTIIIIVELITVGVLVTIGIYLLQNFKNLF